MDAPAGEEGKGGEVEGGGVGEPTAGVDEEGGQARRREEDQEFDLFPAAQEEEQGEHGQHEPGGEGNIDEARPQAQADRRRAIEDPLGNVIQYRYDSRDNRTSEDDALGNDGRPGALDSESSDEDADPLEEAPAASSGLLLHKHPKYIRFADVGGACRPHTVGARFLPAVGGGGWSELSPP